MKSNTTKRVEGKAEEIGGVIQKTAGQVLGNERMEAEGAAHQLTGKGRQEAAKAGERIKGGAERVVGKVKDVVGSAIGDAQMEAEGKAKGLKGKARQTANK